MRIAVIREKECEAPDNCNYICAEVCPVVRKGFRETVYPRENGKAAITESLCIACGICVKRCPFDAIRVINLPDEMMKEVTFQYGVNTFRTFNIATPVEKKVVGLIGRNGIGKTTNINLISNSLRPNFGEYQQMFSTEEIIKRFRGKDIQPFLTKLYSGSLKVAKKPQDFTLTGKVGDIIKNNRFELIRKSLMERDSETLSGGEAQLVKIASILDEDADVYIFDEPMNFLDITHRLVVAETIRTKLNDKTVIVVEHDLVMLDYLTDLIQILYGSDANYGIVSQVMPSRNGINNYIEGYLPSENVRFRNWEIKIKKTLSTASAKPLVSWPEFKVTLGGFNLHTKSGTIYEGDIIGVIGENGIGKTTFIKSLAGSLETSEGKLDLGVKISYKPQMIQRFDSMVIDALNAIKPNFMEDNELSGLINKLDVNKILNKNIKTLSGGELQKVAIVACLMADAEIYLFDEPSANLDIEDRLGTMSIISSFISTKKKSAIVVDHDLMFLDSVCSKSILFNGEAGLNGLCDEITSTSSAINSFLKRVDITMRRDKDSGRPRINLRGSRLDTEQKATNKFFSD
ncbi:MAG: ribosome biogenesis/translation initiation ATPase RLI [Candidatus Parvarchaeota archaeon]|nr:ribosome biogenesis/translation initiation ATPase RLI [Candidatus Parvarchaeota archaeon]